ncbi:MAG: hypothetical protein AMXMBFR56_82200 [Polyangiaceae bacterium]
MSWQRVFENPTRQIREGDNILNIRTDDKWKDFVYGADVPEKVRRSEFDWLEDAEGDDHFIKYKNSWYHLGEFIRTRGGGAAGSPMPDLVEAGWDGIKNESYSSGVLIKVSPNGEQYKIGYYWVTRA